jgi:hypothetical protein
MRGRALVLAIACVIAGCTVTIDSAEPSGGGPDPGPGGPGGPTWQPPASTSWQWQLSGALDMSIDVGMYDVDLFDTPQATIDSLHSAGHRVICYVDVGSWEPNRPDSSQFASAVLGDAMVGWPNERWLDIRDASVATLIDARLDLAVSKQCDGVEPDNVDGYANTTGFPLAAADQLAFNRHVATAAHARGLTVGLKNDLDQVADLVANFDWALNEQCFQYSECSQLQPFVAAHKAVFEVEYGDATLASTICPQANAANFNTLIKDLNLDSWRVACR